MSLKFQTFKTAGEASASDAAILEAFWLCANELLLHLILALHRYNQGLAQPQLRASIEKSKHRFGNELHVLP